MTQQHFDRRAFLAACAAAGAAAGIPFRALAQTGTAPASVQLDQVPSGGRVLAEFTGLSFDASIVPGGGFLNGSNGALIRYVRGLGRGVMQIGGDSVGTTAYSQSDLASVAAFANAVDWRVILALSLSAEPFAVGQQAASAMQALGDRLIAFELGGNPDKEFKTYDAFLSAYRARQQSIAANAPGALFAGPGVLTQLDWLNRFAADGRAALAVLTAHYAHTGPDANQVATLARQMQSTAASADLPYRISRVDSTGEKTLAGGMWAIDFAFRMAQSGADGVNFRDAADGQGGATYQAIQLFAESKDAALVPVHVQSTQKDLTVYAVQRNDGSRAVTIVNRNDNISALVTIDTGSARKISRVRRLTGLSFMSAQTSLSGWSGVSGSVEVPPGSVAVITA